MSTFAESSLLIAAPPASSADTVATVTGLGTGLIPEGKAWVTIESPNSAYIVTLPDAAVGARIRGWIGANGAEVRTPALSGETINSVDSDGTNQAALPATTYFEFERVTATGWILKAWDELGAVVGPIVPDAP